MLDWIGEAVGRDLPDNFNYFSPGDELCCSFHEEDEGEVEGKMKECPETFSEGPEVCAVHPIEVEHVHEILRND